MKKIILLCAGGMSTSLLVAKMKEEAQKDGYACEISAHSTAEAVKVGKDADLILLGPQVRFSLGKVKSQCPGVPVEAIDMRLYGKMDGKALLELAKNKVK